MWIKRKSEDQRLVEYDRDILRSTFVGIFWSAIAERKKLGKFTLQSLAEKLRIDKSAVSRWFSGDAPNWTSDTIADVAGALNLEIKVEARDRTTGQVFIASGTHTRPILAIPQQEISTETEPSAVVATPISTRILTTSG
jgi:transcriptional regulator with XRE-family HTH domain